MTLQELAHKIEEHFDLGELEALCLESGIVKYENLGGIALKDKARNLVQHCERHGELDELVPCCKQLRPKVDWGEGQPVELDVPYFEQHRLKSNEPLTINIISSHAKVGAWNQGQPLSPFEFVIKLDLVNHTPKPVILTGFEISAFEVPHEKLNQSPPTSTLLLVENNNKKFPITFPYQIAGEYFGLFEYQIKIQLDDRERLNFVPDSDAFQDYTVKLSYEYYDTARITYTASILVQDTFQEFKDAWLETWKSYQRNILRRGIINTKARVSLEPFEQPIIPDDNDRWVSVKVINNDNDHLTNCYGILEVDGMPFQLGWRGGSSSGFRDILRGASELIDIARTLKDKGVFAFTTQKWGDWPEKKTGKYSIHVTIGGNLKGKSFIPIHFEGFVEYKGDRDLFIDDESKPSPVG